MILWNSIHDLAKGSVLFVLKGKNTKFQSHVGTLSVGAASSKYIRDLTIELCAPFAGNKLQLFFALSTKEKGQPNKEEG